MNVNLEKKKLNFGEIDHNNLRMSDTEKNHYSDSDSDDEDTFCAYKVYTKNEVRILVSGGGMMNGNAYAEVVCERDEDCDELKAVKYEEFGKNAYSREYPPDHIILFTEGDNFKVVDKNKPISWTGLTIDDIIGK